MADEFIDPYLDLETGILRNFAGANTQEELRKAETDVAGMAELTLDDIPRSNRYNGNDSTYISEKSRL